MNTQEEIKLSGAEFSDDRQYRWVLWRIWDTDLPRVMFIGLNPSTANETQNDNTITKVCKIAKGNGYGGVYMMNCFGFVSTNPKELKRNGADDYWNNGRLISISKNCKDIVFAWGNFKVVTETGRDKELSEMFPEAKCIKQNKNGSPKHPLYCPDNSQLINFKTPQS